MIVYPQYITVHWTFQPFREYFSFFLDRFGVIFNIGQGTTGNGHTAHCALDPIHIIFEDVYWGSVICPMIGMVMENHIPYAPVFTGDAQKAPNGAIHSRNSMQHPAFWAA